MEITINRQIIASAYKGPWLLIINWKKSLNLPKDFDLILGMPLSALKIIFIKGASALMDSRENRVDKSA